MLLPLRSRISILDRYIFWEVAIPCFVSIFVFTGILFLARSVKLFDLVVNRNVPLSDMLLMFAYLVPRFLEIAVPMSVLLGIMLAFGRLSADSELIVIRSAGVSLRRLAYPVIFFALLCTIASVIIACWVRPWANYRLGVGLFELAKLQTSSGLTEGVFHEFGPITLYAETVGDGGRLENVLIADHTDPHAQKTFISNYGQIVSDPSTRALNLRLYEGMIQEGGAKNATVTFFDANTLRLNQDDLIADDENLDHERKTSEMMLPELIHETHTLEETSPPTDDSREDLTKALVELHRRFAVPGACMCVALIAMVLGLQPTRIRGWGTAINTTIGISVIVVYYLFIALFSAIAEHGLMPAAISIWFPNVLAFALGVTLFRRAERELTLWPMRYKWLWTIIKRFSKRSVTASS